MKRSNSFLGLAIVSSVIAVACSSGESGTGPGDAGGAGAGGSAASGGRSAAGGGNGGGKTGGAGGSAASGGTTSTGGSSASGGATGTGGSSASGGTTGTGGSTASGGTTSTGGSTASGGTTSTGGSTASGGTTSTGGSSNDAGTAGTSGSAGSTASGGAPGSGGTSGTGGGLGSGGNTGNGGAQGSGGATGSGGSAVTDGGSPPHKVGRVLVTANVSANGQHNRGSVQLGDADLTLVDAPPFGPAIGSADGCTLYPFASIAPVGESAGTITVTGANDGMSFVPSGSAPLVSYTLDFTGSTTPEFDAGATLAISAAGGPDVGAFSGNVVGPAPIANYTPPTSASRSADLTITWTASTSDSFHIYVVGISSSPQVLVCPTADDGSFTITKNALSLFGAGISHAQVILSRVNETTTSAGDWTIHLDAEQEDTRAAITIGP